MGNESLGLDGIYPRISICMSSDLGLPAYFSGIFYPESSTIREFTDIFSILITTAIGRLYQNQTLLGVSPPPPPPLLWNPQGCDSVFLCFLASSPYHNGNRKLPNSVQSMENMILYFRRF